MKISILDDYHDKLRTLECFAMLSGHDVEVWNDHVQDLDALTERLRETEALVLIASAPRPARRSSVGCRSSGSSAASTRTSTSTPARNWV
jgi:hypothetical protein